MSKQDVTVDSAGATGVGRDRLATAMLTAAALTAIAGFGALFSIWWQSRITDEAEVLRIASQEFVAGRPIVAGELALTAQLAPPDKDQDESPRNTALSAGEIAARAERVELKCLRDFLVGAGKVARAAEEEDFRRARQLRFEAIPYLEASRSSGFPPGRKVEGNRMLGETLYRIGRYDDAIPSLQYAIDQEPSLQRGLLPLLASAQLNALQPTGEQSLATINRYLENPSLETHQRRHGELIRIKALLNLKRWQEAGTAIDRGLASSAASQPNVKDDQSQFRQELRLLRAMMRIQQAQQRFGKQPIDPLEDRSQSVAFLSSTVNDLAELEREADPQITARARLWAARAYLVQGRQEEALTQLTAVRQQRPFGAAGIVGGLEEIELLADRGRGFEMLLTTKYVMRELVSEQGFDARLITFDEFRRRLRQAIDQLRRLGEYEHAIDAARSLPPVFARSEALIQEARGFQEWADATLADGTDIGGEVARNAAKLARSRYRAAGDAYGEAAQIEFDTPQYLPIQWSAIEAYQKGRHFTRSIELLEPYLRYEDRSRRPRGLVAYGRALLAVGKPDEALEALTTCIVEFDRDPMRYDARLLAALAHADLGDLDGARSLLTDNLQDGELTPQSEPWRDSLLTLGELLYQRGYQNHLKAEHASGQERLTLLRENQPILEEAIRRLDEAVTRYWPLPRAESAAYLSARTHVLAAEWPRVEAQSPEILDAARRALRARIESELQTAFDSFQSLRKHLIRREEEHRLPEKQQAMLRNCFLAEADTLREMAEADTVRDPQRWKEAADTYRAVSLRYMNEPTALEAILGQSRCAKEMGQDQEAELLIRRANVVLQRIPNEWNGRFAEVTRFDRNNWEKLLTWMTSRLDNNTSGT